MTRSSSPTPRFLTMAQVSEQLGTSSAQTYALVRSGALRANKVGGRGQWRIGVQDLEDYVAASYQQTREFIKRPPWPPAPGTSNDEAQLEEA